MRVHYDHWIKVESRYAKELRFSAFLPHVYPSNPSLLYYWTNYILFSLTDDDIIQFGGLISSSNMTLTSEITVENSHPVIWTFDCAP